MYRNRNDELAHYGVKGMRWGVRRGLEELSRANTSGDKGAHNHAVATLSTHRDKIKKKMTKLDRKGEKLERMRYEQATKTEVKSAKLSQKAAKLRSKADMTRSADRAHKRYAKANRLDYRVSQMQAQVAKTKAKIEKNKKFKSLFEQGLNDINKELITKGQDFLYMKPNGLPYTLAD